jgi:hypothetical protein
MKDTTFVPFSLSPVSSKMN